MKFHPNAYGIPGYPVKPQPGLLQQLGGFEPLQLELALLSGQGAELGAEGGDLARAAARVTRCDDGGWRT